MKERYTLDGVASPGLGVAVDVVVGVGVIVGGVGVAVDSVTVPEGGVCVVVDVVVDVAVGGLGVTVDVAVGVLGISGQSMPETSNLSIPASQVRTSRSVGTHSDVSLKLNCAKLVRFTSLAGSGPFS